LLVTSAIVVGNVSSKDLIASRALSAFSACSNAYSEADLPLEA